MGGETGIEGHETKLSTSPVRPEPVEGLLFSSRSARLRQAQPERMMGLAVNAWRYI
ncbi:hypothetical protein EBBID32_22880 [Sphingobium indicum BiD32]|uniref:Uncharacterized protein n=1 Tax=Sphingobium indicum BiD32 TaxID=1301087 RepID=N1MMG8_9SPHN|nr:hypothetical protein EBBID32_22880 [Sphingobium indicum BiD32]